MLKLTFTTTLLTVALLSPLPAQEPNFFPLQVGNQWIYRATGAAGGQPVTVQVRDSARMQAREYFLVTGLGEGSAWLRQEAGTLYAFDRDSGQETVWLRFTAPEGETYQTAIDPCNSVAGRMKSDDKVETPAGTFRNPLTIGYPNARCADAGLSRDVFAASIGLAQRTMTTIAGPRTLSLIYARIGETTVVSQPEVAFGLSLDRAVYTTRLVTPVLTARLTLRVTRPEPLELVFPSGQRFDVEIKNAKGDVVLRWSDGKMFTLIYGSQRFGPGETNWIAEMPLVDARNNLLDPGKYTAEAWLTTEGERRYAATVGFEISSDR